MKGAPCGVDPWDLPGRGSGRRSYACLKSLRGSQGRRPRFVLLAEKSMQRQNLTQNSREPASTMITRYLPRPRHGQPPRRRTPRAPGSSPQCLRLVNNPFDCHLRLGCVGSQLGCRIRPHPTPRGRRNDHPLGQCLRLGPGADTSGPGATTSDPGADALGPGTDTSGLPDG